MNDEAKLKQLIDEALDAAARVALSDGANLGMVIDRMMTFAAAQACLTNGSPDVAKQFHAMGDRIAGGLFHCITGEGGRH